MLLEATPSTVTVGLSDVVDRLRLRLEEDPQPRALDHDCETWLNNFLTQAEKSERELLPRRIQRALHQMQNMTRHWSEKAFARGAYDEAERWRALAHVAQPAPDDELRPDPHDAAERWLRLVQPLIEQTRQQRRRRYSRLRDIDPLLRTTSLDLATVEDVFAGIEATEPFSHRISACILGVPDA